MRRIIQKGALGEKVRDRTAELGKSISAVERESGLSPGMVSRWIAAGSEDYNTLSKLVTMADLLEISLDELVGRQVNVSRVGTSDSIIPQLQSETCAGQLVWLSWQSANEFPVATPIPTDESGRLCCGGWWTERKELKFILISFCDDIQDEDEQLELSLYCTPGHRLPLFPVLPDSDSTLSMLYTQILLNATFVPTKGTGALGVHSMDVVGQKTIPFRVQSG